MTLYAAVRGTTLYVATVSPGNTTLPNDHFLFVTDTVLTSASAPAPWAKTGRVAVDASKPFVAGESTSNFCGWTNAPASSQAAKSSTSSGQMEATIDLVQEFGRVPDTIYLAAAAYGTADGGTLANQCPLGNSDGNLDPDEFLVLSAVALNDNNADGTYDRLDPNTGFLITQIVHSDQSITITWPSVPGRTYQVESSDSPGGSWTSLGTALTAAPGQLTLSATDSTTLSARFYRVRLVSP